MPSNIAANNNPALLSVQGLSIQAGDRRILDQLSFTLCSGQTLAMVGESGSGKSMTAYALLGLLNASMTATGSAELTLNGSRTNIIDPAFKQWQQVRGNKIGMIFQEPMSALNPLHTVERQVVESLLAAESSFNEKWYLAQVHTQSRAYKRLHSQVLDLLSQVGIQDPASKCKAYPHQLSGGQRQRVMIAMALAQMPDILIADEPTTALDASLQHQILQLLQTLQQSHGFAMLLISHDLAMVRQYANTVMVLSKGQLIEQGPTEELFANPKQPYTQALLNPNMGSPVPLAASASPLVQAVDIGVQYTLRKNWFSANVTHHALKPFSFTIGHGESLGIVGESGSGKSTLALALTELVQKTGHVKWAQTAGMPTPTAKQQRALIQLVFQDPYASLNPRYTVAQALLEGMHFHADHLYPGIGKAGARDAAIANDITQVMTQVQLPASFLSRYPHQLSGGQRQRVAIARAIVLRPKLLILDEPTSSLDRTTQLALLAVLRDIQAQTGMAYLFISHDLAVVRSLCHRVAVLHQGQVIETGPTEQLYTQPTQAYTKHLMDAALPQTKPPKPPSPL